MAENLDIGVGFDPSGLCWEMTAEQCFGLGIDSMVFVVSDVD